MSRGGNPSSVFRPTPTLVPASIAALLTGGRQIALPVADGSVGSWTTELGSTTNEYLSVSEASPSDYTYVRSVQVSNAITFTFGPLLAPITGADPVLHVRYDKQPSGMQINLQIDLLQSGIIVQTWTYTNISEDWTGADLVITGVTDYTAPLSITFTDTPP